jgi:hypothetical protein
MLRLKTKKTHDQAASDLLPVGNDVYNYHVEQVFLGHHTIFTLLGLAIGADLVGRTIYEFIVQYANPVVVVGIGLILFILSGLLIGSFND